MKKLTLNQKSNKSSLPEPTDDELNPRSADLTMVRMTHILFPATAL